MNNYKFYIQRTDAEGNTDGLPLDLEKDFPGLRYRLCDGLETLGEMKNAYSEEYAEADHLRLWHPTDANLTPTHSATELELELVITGEQRRDTLSQLRAFLREGRIYYWDTARHRKAWLALIEEQKVEEDTLKGITYIDVIFAFTNLWGLCKDCTDSGEVIEFGDWLCIQFDTNDGSIWAGPTVTAYKEGVEAFALDTADGTLTATTTEGADLSFTQSVTGEIEVTH